MSGDTESLFCGFSFAQLTPEQRMQLGGGLSQAARQQGQSFPDANQDGIDDRLQDPDYLAQTATQVEQQRPGLLGRILRVTMPCPSQLPRRAA